MCEQDIAADIVFSTGEKEDGEALLMPIEPSHTLGLAHAVYISKSSDSARRTMDRCGRVEALADADMPDQFYDLVVTERFEQVRVLSPCASKSFVSRNRNRPPTKSRLDLRCVVYCGTKSRP